MIDLAYVEGLAGLIFLSFMEEIPESYQRLLREKLEQRKIQVEYPSYDTTWEFEDWVKTLLKYTTLTEDQAKVCLISQHNVSNCKSDVSWVFNAPKEALKEIAEISPFSTNQLYILNKHWAEEIYPKGIPYGKYRNNKTIGDYVDNDRQFWRLVKLGLRSRIAALEIKLPHKSTTPP